MSFVDEVNIHVHSGAGGNGCRSFRREKYIPFGGPNGGNGGKGGDVYLSSTLSKNCLLDFKYQPIFKAKRGAHGMGSDMDGRSGADLIIKVPVGTLIYERETGELLGDLVSENQEIRIAKGGLGGRGNLSFKSSTNRAPTQTTPGREGESFGLRLELRLLADVGLVGLPNAGKSSFLRVISRAQPKVGNYPFTTLDPVLGVASQSGMNFVVADLPGLIEGASEGAGLGHQFLKHVRRNRLLLHLVDFSAETEAIKSQIEMIRHEISQYDSRVSDIPEILVFTKADLLESEKQKDKLAELKSIGLEGFLVSSHTQYGLKELLTTVTKYLILPTQHSEEESDEGDLRRHV